MLKTRIGSWAWSDQHGEACRIVDMETIWGTTYYQVWLPTANSVARLRGDDLRPVSERTVHTEAHVTYLVAAACIIEALADNVLLAPLASRVIPLPHQLCALSRALDRQPVRCLLADEVGLGKTIEAGLILRELKLRGLVRRTLIVAPKGLVTQWVAEMRAHFDEGFQLVLPEDAVAYRQVLRDQNPWRAYDQVVCAMDAVKPLEARRGWSREQVEEYNRLRFEDLLAAGWDLVIVDEAHRLAGATDAVARYKLGQGLATAAPYLLLLSATPHQGKTDGFYRLVSLLDRAAFPDVSLVNRERVRPYVIRTEKRGAIDAQGRPLFKPRATRLVPVAWEERHQEQQCLYAAVTEYVRQGYNQALSEKKNYVGFLMTLMQRLVTSSTHAIRSALERRLTTLQVPEEQADAAPTLSVEDWADLDGQEQMDALLSVQAAMRHERDEVEMLLKAACRAEARGPDAKADALLDWIYRLQQEETAPELKVLIFTEFVATQEMLRAFLTERGFSVVCLNGAMDLDERRRVQEAFAAEARILVSTDAGGEGLNLQFCHVVINYDIPWNPMRIEQRIGRVDRIGQAHPVRALNFVCEDTVEYRVREVLEEKLAVILDEFGVDKTGDVLDGGRAEQFFDSVYVESILNPGALDTAVSSALQQVRDQVRAERDAAVIPHAAGIADAREARRLLEHPLPYWLERMVIAHLQTRGGRAERCGRSWTLTWPGGEVSRNVVFNARETAADPIVVALTLEDVRVRDLLTRLPRVVQGEPIPSLLVPTLQADVRGFWSLWRVALETADGVRQRILPLFQHDNGRILPAAARRIWERFLTDEAEIHDCVCGEPAAEAYGRARAAAEAYGQPLYQELVHAHNAFLAREKEKGEYAFEARRQAIQRHGLPEVRAHRLAQLERDERAWRDRLGRLTETSPDLAPVLVVHVSGGASMHA